MLKPFMMENTNRRMLYTLFWVLNFVIAAIVVISAGMGIIMLRSFFHVSSVADILPAIMTHADRYVWTIYSMLFIRLIYIAGLVYILALLNMIVYKILKGRIYEKPQLHYIRRIGYLLLL